MKFLLLFLTACATQRPHPEDSVTTAERPDDVYRKCKKLGEVESNVQGPAFVVMLHKSEVDKELRRKAARMGGDTIYVVKNESVMLENNVTAAVFRCHGKK